ncbi:hypothetical protein CC2G_012246 [Coprinopsis cinerea AmutBmut pab1-1]|nr:hypothetical protein CC2G_012246 [Coprinopsis cinerea AmutBmut pab1-1]
MFPLELFEATVERLAAEGTLDDLRQCALANKQLARLCQKQIFHTVALVQKPVPRLVWPSDSEERVSLPPHPIERFANVVKQNPAIGTYVRELEIESMRDYNVDDGFTVLGHLHQVHTFTLVFADGPRHVGIPKPWHTVSLGLQNSLFSFAHRNTITSLSLYHLSDLPPTFLQRFSHLQRLTVLGVHPDSSICPATGESYIKLKELELLDETVGFAEHFILHPTAHTFDISEISSLKVDFGINDDDHVVGRILHLPVQLEELDLHLSKNFSEWTCRGNVLSRLPPPSLNTLRRIALFIDTIDTPELPPYAEFVHELTRLQGQNVLEELRITVMCQFDSDLNLDPIRWKELGDLLSSGFPCLRKLTLHVKVSIFDGPSPFEEAARKQVILEKILDESFALIDPNVELITSARCREI